MADETLFALGDDDAAVFREMAAEFRRRRQAGQVGAPPPVPPGHPRGLPDQPGDPPWMMVVLTPPGGIPAMCEETIGGGRPDGSAGTGSGTQGDATCGTGTGTAVGDAGDRPGFADCTIYMLQNSTAAGRPLTHPRLEPTSYTVTVYNARFTAINGSQFVTALRDQLGYWWVPQNGDLFTTCT